MNVVTSIKNNAPYISFGVGVVSSIGSVALGIRATMRLEDVLDAYTKELSIIKSVDVSEIKDPNRAKLIKMNQERDIERLNRKYFLKLTGLYGPSIGLLGLSIGAFGFSVGTLNARLTGAMGALNGVTAAFNAYRGNVIEDLGEEADLRYYYGLSKDKETVEIEDEETGKIKKVKKDILTGIPSGLYCYRFEKYDPSSETGFTQWDETPSYSYCYIDGIIRNWQYKLNTGKKVWLLDILKDLGAGENVIDPAAHFAGWVPGDIIDCGLSWGDIKDTNNYLSGECPDVTLRFNCRANLYSEVYDIPDIVEEKVVPLELLEDKKEESHE